MGRFPLIQVYRPDGSCVHLKGQQAQTMFLLATKGARGVRAFDFRGGPAFRLAAYVHALRHEKGFAIHMELEPHVGGSHAVYFLDEEVRLGLAQGTPDARYDS